ncbi:unnamed protein product [Paramecium octaurelia]|uniref:Uncharacterized protein n=1 Tax=Paramecium octaurelia TaxID=43137 RepID=A0A8S1WZ99_PAROT|nr:unnamed protein product [Paramecium octaurelia]
MNPTYDLLGMIGQVEQQIVQLVKIKPQESQQVPSQKIEDQPLFESVQEQCERNSVYSSQRTRSDNSSQILLHQLQTNLEVIKKGINELLVYNKNTYYDQLRNHLNTKEGKIKCFVRSENTYDSDQNKGIQKNIKLEVQGAEASIKNYKNQMDILTNELKSILSSKIDLQKRQRIQHIEQQYEELRKNLYFLRQLQDNIMQLVQCDASFEDTLKQCKARWERKN